MRRFNLASLQDAGRSLDHVTAVLSLVRAIRPLLVDIAAAAEDGGHEGVFQNGPLIRRVIDVVEAQVPGDPLTEAQEDWLAEAVVTLAKGVAVFTVPEPPSRAA